MSVTTLALTLLHFIWQGTLVATAAALTLRVMAKANPAARYNAAVLALAVLAVLPLVTAWRLRTGASGGPSQEPSHSSAKSGVDTSNAAVSVPEPPRERTSTTTRLGAGSDNEGPLQSARWQSWSAATAPYVVRAWLCGVLVLSIRLLGGWLGTRRLVHAGIKEPSEFIMERFTAAVDKLALSRPVRLFESALVHTPAAIGFLRPVVLWPISLQSGLTVAQIDLLLMHELAHLKRHDYLVNLLQSVVETALFYHPAVWWLSARVRDERELCCDDIALGTSSADGKERVYAEALMALSEARVATPALVPAATGGGLLRRIHRLIAQPRLDSASDRERVIRPGWTALPLALAATAGILVSTTPAPTAARPQELQSSMEIKGEVERRLTGPVSPTAVHKFQGSGSLAERFAWARAEAKRTGDDVFSIGYAIAADSTQSLIYFDRHVPIAVSEGSILTGHLRFKARDQIKVAGISPDAVIGSRATLETIVLLAFRGGALERVHASSASLPIHFDGKPLYWLESATDQESLALGRELFPKTAPVFQEDLVALAAVHSSAPQVSTALQRWFAETSNERVRVGIIEAMGPLDSPDVLPFLERVARSKESRDVRREAAESIGDQPVGRATDVLGALARELTDVDVATEAAESLGARSEARAFDELSRLVWSDLNVEVQREAVETMGDSKFPRQLAELKKVVMTHPNLVVRREAVETLGDLKDPGATLGFLRELAASNADSGVREEAVETIGNLGDARSVEALTEIARSSHDIDVKRRALEALRDTGNSDTALAEVRSMLKSGTNGRDARLAVDLLGDFDSKEAVALLMKAAMEGRSPEIQHAAAKALGDVAPVDEAFAALESIIATHSSPEVQRAAVEAMSNIDMDGKTARLVRIAESGKDAEVKKAAIEALGGIGDARAALEELVRSTADEDVQVAAIEAYASEGHGRAAANWLADRVRDSPERAARAALEGLANLDADGIEAVIAVARTSQNRELRKRAVEILGESADPRAKAELRRILSQ